MRIFFTGKNFSQGLKDVDQTSLFSVAQLNGILVSKSLTSLDDFLVCVDFESAALKQVKKAERLGVRTVLVVNEPEVVIPQHAKRRILKKFDKIIYVGRPMRNPKLKWPQTWTNLRMNGSRKDRAVLVNADKWSFIGGHQYWLRAAISSKDSRVDVYGPGWSRPQLKRTLYRVSDFLRTLLSRTRPSFQGLRYVLARPKQYLGTVEDKVEMMSCYKVALVIENSSELITEKLFDAWFAGCVPVFVGSKVGEMEIPENLVFESNPDIESVKAAMDLAFSVNIHEFHANLENFLRSTVALEWQAKRAIAKILAEATTTNSAS